LLIALAILLAPTAACDDGEPETPESSGARQRPCQKDASRAECATRAKPAPRPEHIVYGEPAPPGAWPWMVRLDIHLRTLSEKGWFECGGTLLAPRLVLTAAHCVTDEIGLEAVTTRGAWATLGRRDLGDHQVGEEIRVARIVVHGRYEAFTKENDLALLRLSRSSRQVPAVIGAEDDWGSLARAMGWGRTGTNRPSSELLMAVDLPLVQDEDCGRFFGEFDPDVMLCAGGVRGDTCFGDSGGPLMVPGGPRDWKLIGVTSFGRDECAAPGVPAVYAWVAGDELHGWIARHS
jgi:trypsin